MSSADPRRPAVRSGRREPPQFRRVTVRRVEQLSPRMVRVAVSGPELAGLTIDEPAASVRVLLPSPGSNDLMIPTWNGNEFLLPDRSRPTIRTITPRRLDRELLELDLEIVLHDGGAVSEWAEAAGPGSPAAISGPGRGYTIDREASAFLLAGDETAIPAITQLLEVLPTTAQIAVHIEVADPDARLAIPDRVGTTVTWHDLPRDASPGDAFGAAIQAAEFDPAALVWVAGEAAGVQRVRRYLFEVRQLPRSRATIRGYWKHGRSGGSDDAL